jgi:hypothetical protein
MIFEKMIFVLNFEHLFYRFILDLYNLIAMGDDRRLINVMRVNKMKWNFANVNMFKKEIWDVGIKISQMFSTLKEISETNSDLVIPNCKNYRFN